MLHIILYAIIPILVVMAAGYISGKKGVFSAKDGKAFKIGRASCRERV